MDELEVRLSSRRTFDGLLAAIGAAVVDGPEHPAGQGVTLGAHYLVDETSERLDVRAGLPAPKDLCAMDIPCREVSQRSRALVLKLHALDATTNTRQGLVAADADLNRGLLIGG